MKYDYKKKIDIPEFTAEDFSKKPSYYFLLEFPYPSGAGLHVGHCRSYVALDALVRHKRMQGFNVLFPMGWDAFGLPAENYAIKHGIHPSVSTAENIANFKQQTQRIGISFDWSREINTTDPSYYKWTQWIFLQLYKHGLAYRDSIPVNWCPSCKIGLANEEAVGGHCERCGAETEKKELSQWLIRITKYADRLISDLDGIDFPDRVKIQQKEWIGRSEGAEVDFMVGEEKVSVFTTRPDTIFGVQALVLSPEHPLVKESKDEKVKEYCQQAQKKSEFQRAKMEKEKTGAPLGIKAINPINGEEIPVWVGDYVIGTYGGGAVMVVPAHDERDLAFCERYNLPVKQVISDGILVDSGDFSGQPEDKAQENIIKFLEEKGLGRKKVNYKLRDWIFSRQHYWGEPIPIIHCPVCGVVPVPEEDLPVELPHVEKYEPTHTGESPLANMTDWVNVKCPRCSGPAKRETDTMPNWAGSNWYYIRYIDPHNDKELADPEKMKKWLPVDWYNGGMEHTTLHLLYSRFIFKFLYDIKAVPCSEPYQKRTSHGMILAEDGRKMSKSIGNVINPDDMVERYGADAFRLYELFIGPFEQQAEWQESGIRGVYRFLEKTWDVCLNNQKESKVTDEVFDELIAKVNRDVDRLKFNTVVSAFMEFVNLAQKEGISLQTAKRLAILLAPFACFFAEDLWQTLGQEGSVHHQSWLLAEEKVKETYSLLVQVDGKVRDRITVPSDITSEIAFQEAMKSEKIKKWVTETKKNIFVPGRVLNIITK